MLIVFVMMRSFTKCFSQDFRRGRLNMECNLVLINHIPHPYPICVYLNWFSLALCYNLEYSPSWLKYFIQFSNNFKNCWCLHITPSHSHLCFEHLKHRKRFCMANIELNFSHLIRQYVDIELKEHVFWVNWLPDGGFGTKLRPVGPCLNPENAGPLFAETPI